MAAAVGSIRGSEIVCDDNQNVGLRFSRERRHGEYGQQEKERRFHSGAIPRHGDAALSAGAAAPILDGDGAGVWEIEGADVCGRAVRLQGADIDGLLAEATTMAKAINKQLQKDG